MDQGACSGASEYPTVAGTAEYISASVGKSGKQIVGDVFIFFVVNTFNTMHQTVQDGYSGQMREDFRNDFWGASLKHGLGGLEIISFGAGFYGGVRYVDNALGLTDEAVGLTDEAIQGVDELLDISNIRFHEDSGQLQHIFRDAPGHLADDTVENRQLLFDTVTQNNFVRADVHGNRWFARILDDGTEAWVSVRNGIIQNGGVNDLPRYTGR